MSSLRHVGNYAVYGGKYWYDVAPVLNGHDEDAVMNGSHYRICIDLVCCILRNPNSH